MPPRLASNVAVMTVLLVLLCCCLSTSAVLGQSVAAAPAPPSFGTFPPLPYRQLAAFTDVYPGLPVVADDVGMAVDDSGNLYLSSFGDSVQVLYANHTQKAVIPAILYTLALAIDANGDLYAGSYFYGSIVKYSPQGDVLFTYDISATLYATPTFSYPFSLVVDKAGLLWIAYEDPEASSSSVVVYNTSGLVAEFSNYTNSPTVAINAARDTVYIGGGLDGANNTIDVWDTATLALTKQISTGTYEVYYLGAALSGGFYVSGNGFLYELDSNGAIVADLSSLFVDPASIAVNPVTGLVYVNDGVRTGITVLDPATNSVQTIFRGGLNSANAVAVDAEGSMYIASLAGVLVLFANGSEKALYQMDLQFPTGVFVASDGNAYVSSYQSKSTTLPLGYVTVFSPAGTVLGNYNYSGAAADTIARALTVDSTARTIYVLNGAGQIVVMSAADGAVLAVHNTSYTAYSITVGGIALSPDDALLYVGTGVNASVAVFTTAGVQTATYDLSAYGVQPYGVTVAADGTLYAADLISDAGRVIVMDAGTSAVRGQLQVPIDRASYYINNGQLGVAVDAQGILYAAHQVGVFKYQPVTGQQLTINLATGFTSATYSAPLSTVDGAHDANWQAEGAAVPVLTPSGADFNPAWEVNGPTSDWLGVPADADVTGGSINFTRTFTLPATLDVSTLTLTGAVTCDKSCLVYINDQLLRQAYSNALYTLRQNTFAATTEQLILGDVNTLTVVLSTVNTSTDPGAQYSGVRVEGFVNAVTTAGGGGAVLGDPLFVGLLGQRFQVHGLDGAVYSLVSDASLQLNARFTFIGEPRACPVLPSTGAKAATCWSHPGSYLSETAVQVRSDNTLPALASASASAALEKFAVHTVVLRAGDAASGFVSVRVNGVELVDGANRSSADSAVLRVRFLSSHELSIATPLLSMQWESIDGFTNLRLLQPAVSLAELARRDTHGLLGQTHTRHAQHREVEHVAGYVDDYADESGALTGCATVYNRFRCASDSE